MAKPKTATLKLEIVNDDGSKTIVTTANLDASKLREKHGYSRNENDPDHIVIGMSDPYADDDDFFSRRRHYVDRLLDRPFESHFFLNLRLEPVKKGETVYTIEKIDPPVTRVVMALRQGKPELQTLTESEAAGMADLYDGLHMFLLDVPS